MNLFLHGAKDFKILQGDTLRDPKFLRAGKLQKFDCVIANPPFGLSKWGADQFSSDPYGRNIWGSPSDSSADFAWLQHMVASMKDKTGRCAVILPQGVLFHGGHNGEMRNQLVDSGIVEAVITLVGGVFFAAGVNACILLLNNNKQESHRDKICMIDASEIYTAQRAQNIMTDDDIKEVFELYQNYENVIDKCKIVKVKDLKESLVPSDYIERKPTEKLNVLQIKTNYMKEYEKLINNEKKMYKLLEDGGFVNE